MSNQITGAKNSEQGQKSKTYSIIIKIGHDSSVIVAIREKYTENWLWKFAQEPVNYQC